MYLLSESLSILKKKNMEQCSVCLESFIDKVTLDCCVHQFCKLCILAWCERNSSCPECRGSITSITDVENLVTPVTKTVPAERAGIYVISLEGLTISALNRLLMIEEVQVSPTIPRSPRLAYRRRIQRRNGLMIAIRRTSR